MIFGIESWHLRKVLQLYGTLERESDSHLTIHFSFKFCLQFHLIGNEMNHEKVGLSNRESIIEYNVLYIIWMATVIWIQ